MKTTINPNAVREAKSNISILPLGSKIIVKVIYEASYLELADTSKDKKYKPVSNELVAFGDETHTIELGDKLKITNYPIKCENVFIKNNDKSAASYEKRIQDGTIIVQNNVKYQIEEYFVHEFQDVVGIIE